MNKIRRYLCGLSRQSFKHGAGWLTACCLILLLGLELLAAPAAWAGSAEAFTIGRRPLKITVLVGPRGDFCYSDQIDAIGKLANSVRDRVNKAGGIACLLVEI